METGAFPRVVIPTQPPAQERSAIKLSGRTVNPAPEAWETRVETGPANAGSASTNEPELWVRNVSQATLEPFLVDPAKATGAAMIVAPGGAFLELAIEREGYSIAKWLNQHGIAAFVLKYRLAPSPADPRQAHQQMAQWAHDKLRPPHYPHDSFTPEQREAEAAAVRNGSEAVRYLRAHADQFNISPERIGFIGFSAGAVTALGVALQTDTSGKPNIVAAIYGVLPAGHPVTSEAPPAFIAVAADDPFSPLSVAIHETWQSNGAASELHVLASGGHGFGMLRQGKDSDRWPEMLDHWLDARGFETRLQ
jgi:acetyl esterase/lipase